MLKIQTLASGSRGNSTYVATATTHILVDVGLTLPQFLKRLGEAKIDPESISAILITHEHSDHIAGVASFSKRFGTPVMVHRSAKKCLETKLKGQPPHLIQTFDEPLAIGDIQVDFFRVPHDSTFCFGYVFQNEGCKFSLATDLGHIKDEVFEKMRGSQIVLLESNHDTEKLELNNKYPGWLKRRIAGNTGHLSNTSAAAAILKLYTLGVKQVILGHLSAENNSPTLAYHTVRDFIESKGLREGTDIHIDVAHQNEIGHPYQID